MVDDIVDGVPFGPVCLKCKVGKALAKPRMRIKLVSLEHVQYDRKPIGKTWEQILVLCGGRSKLVPASPLDLVSPRCTLS